MSYMLLMVWMQIPFSMWISHPSPGPAREPPGMITGTASIPGDLLQNSIMLKFYLDLRYSPADITGIELVLKSDWFLVMIPT